MWPSQIITDKMSRKRIISAGEMYSSRHVEWAGDHFGLDLTKIDPLLTKIRGQNDFYIFVPSDLDL